MDTERRIHPIDVTTLSKGDRLPIEQVEQIVNCSRASPAFAFRVLSLKGWIERSLRNHGKVWTLRVDHGAICILTDVEAVQYNFRQHRVGCRKTRRSLRRQIAVDVSNLTEEQKVEHDKMLTRQAGVVAAMNRKKLPVLPEPHKRIE